MRIAIKLKWFQCFRDIIFISPTWMFLEAFLKPLSEFFTEVKSVMTEVFSVTGGYSFIVKTKLMCFVRPNEINDTITITDYLWWKKSHESWFSCGSKLFYDMVRIMQPLLGIISTFDNKDTIMAEIERGVTWPGLARVKQ